MKYNCHCNNARTKAFLPTKQLESFENLISVKSLRIIRKRVAVFCRVCTSLYINTSCHAKETSWLFPPFFSKNKKDIVALHLVCMMDRKIARSYIDRSVMYNPTHANKYKTPTIVFSQSDPKKS